MEFLTLTLQHDVQLVYHGQSMSEIANKAEYDFWWGYLVIDSSLTHSVERVLVLQLQSFRNIVSVLKVNGNILVAQIGLVQRSVVLSSNISANDQLVPKNNTH